MYRIPLLILAMAALLFAIWAGLLRVGWAWPTIQPDLAAAHGPLMISAFLGTVIGLERAVALGKRPAYVVPLLSSIGGLLLITGLSWMWAMRLMLLASAGLVVLFVLIVRRHKAVYTIVMALGSLAWLIGNLLQISGKPFHIAVPWWMAFLILTIAGERLELSRVLRLSRRTISLFAVATAIYIAGVALSTIRYDAGVRLAGLGMLAISLWLIVFDIARRNIRHRELTRYIAICLFSGYFWLALGGVLWIVYGGVIAGPIYDAILHSVFVGFVFSMIFGHAPLIFPSILGRPMGYLPGFYIHLGLLHASLVIRVVGDLVNNVSLRQWGSLLNGAALLLFLVSSAYALLRGTFNNPSTTNIDRKIGKDLAQ